MSTFTTRGQCFRFQQPFSFDVAPSYKKRNLYQTLSNPILADTQGFTIQGRVQHPSIPTKTSLGFHSIKIKSTNCCWALFSVSPHIFTTKFPPTAATCPCPLNRGVPPVEHHQRPCCWSSRLLWYEWSYDCPPRYWSHLSALETCWEVTVCVIVVVLFHVGDVWATKLHFCMWNVEIGHTALRQCG